MSKYLSFDVGSKTVGIASSSGIIASVHSTVRFREYDFKECALLLEPIIKEEKPELIIVGLPKNMDNSMGHRVEMVNDFVENLVSQNIWTKEKIEFIDERLTTRMAKSIMISANASRKKQKQSKDELAAVLILETFLNKIGN